MIDPNTTEIMNLELDGTATEAQRKRLRHILETDAEARAHFEVLRALAGRLDAHPQLEPPSEMHPRIMAAIDAAPAPRAYREGGIGAWLSGILAPPRRRLVATFGLGLATGVFLLAAVQFGRSGFPEGFRGVDPSQVSGTLAPQIASELVASIPVPATEAGADGNVQVFQQGDETVAEVSFLSDSPVSWILEFDPARLAVTRVDAVRQGYFSVSPGQVHGLSIGQDPLKIVFDGRAEPVQSIVLKVVKDDRVVFERSARPNP